MALLTTPLIKNMLRLSQNNIKRNENMKKLNAVGITHLLIPLVVVVVGVAAVGTYMLVDSYASRPCVKRTIGPGNVGGCTLAVQRMMLLDKQDGKYGAQTKAEVKRFQGNAGLKADGIVGKKTWQKLCRNTKINLPSSDTRPSELTSTIRKGYKQASCSIIT